MQIHAGRGQDMPAYSYALNNPIAFSDETGLDVSLCSKTVQISILDKLGVKHKWIKTDTKEAGVGAVNEGQGDYPYVTETKIKDHSGVSSAPGATCENVEEIDESCVDRLLEIGKRTGRWALDNNCQTFTHEVLNACRKGRSVPVPRDPLCVGNKC